MSISLKVLIVGCGRSGTGFLASLINTAGIPCSHEQLFTPYGPIGKGSTGYESSWCAAPFLHSLNPSTKILHIVRHPDHVRRSFHRIGMLADSPWHNITQGRPRQFVRLAMRAPGAATARIRYVQALRRLVAEHTTVFDHPTEAERLDAYWTSWNLLIEHEGSKRGVKYKRLRLEDIEDQLPALERFLDLSSSPDMERVFRNKKPNYTKREDELPPMGALARDLAQRYGYNA